MEKEKLIYDFVVGYMLKIIKSKIKITKFKEEFNAIKHGDYISFIKLIGVGYPNDIIVLKEGGDFISSEKQIEMKNVDFLLLILSGQAMKDFYKRCYAEFGDISDPDLKDEHFENLANFEMILRMFTKTKFIFEDRITLEEIIKLISKELLLSDDETKKIQNGRLFLNMVKGHKAKFNSFKDGLNSFKESLEILKKYEITIEI